MIRTLATSASTRSPLRTIQTTNTKRRKTDETPAPKPKLMRQSTSSTKALAISRDANASQSKSKSNKKTKVQPNYLNKKMYLGYVNSNIEANRRKDLFSKVVAFNTIKGVQLTVHEVKETFNSTTNWEKVNKDYDDEVKVFMAERREFLQAKIREEKECSIRSRARRERERGMFTVPPRKGQDVYDDVVDTKLTWLGTFKEILYNRWLELQSSTNKITHLGIIAYFANWEVTQHDNDQVHEQQYDILTSMSATTDNKRKMSGLKIFSVIERWCIRPEFDLLGNSMMIQC